MGCKFYRMQEIRTSTSKVLKILHIVTWAAFIGFAVKGGAFIWAFAYSLYKPSVAGHLYNGLNLSNVRDYSMLHYALLTILIAAPLVLNAYIAYLIGKLLSAIRISHPFTEEIADLLEKISYFIFGAWVLALLHNFYIDWLSQNIPNLPEQPIPVDFIFLAGVIFVFAQVFKKGVELQSEKDLTI